MSSVNLKLQAPLQPNGALGYSQVLSSWLAGPLLCTDASFPASCKTRNRVNVQTMEQFLAEVEKKAYRMAEIATQSPADALDIVQDTMIKLVEKYADKPSAEWKPLFYKILQSRITDHFRRKTLHSRLFFWKSPQADDKIDDDLLLGQDHKTPEREVAGQRNVGSVLQALKKLPHRQQQCFMLRNWEGLSVSDTATAMGCSQGSVKTHYSRARQALQLALIEEVEH